MTCKQTNIFDLTNIFTGWRVKEEKQISGSKSGYALRRARSNLVSDEALKLAHLAANRDEHKIAEKHENDDQ